MGSPRRKADSVLSWVAMRLGVLARASQPSLVVCKMRTGVLALAQVEQLL